MRLLTLASVWAMALMGTHLLGQAAVQERVSEPVLEARAAAKDRESLERNLLEAESQQPRDPQRIIALWRRKVLLLLAAPPSPEVSRARQAALRSVLRLLDETRTPQPDRRHYLQLLGSELMATDDYGEARTVFERALALMDAEPDPMTPERASLRVGLLHALGVCHRYLGQPASAEGYYRRALELLAGPASADSGQLATTLESFGLLLQDQARFAEALPLLEQNLRLREQRFGPSHAAVARALNALALAYKALGQREKALSLLERALAIREGQEPAVPNDIAISLNNLAVLLLEMGRNSQAIVIQERSVEIRRRFQGEDSDAVATGMNNLGLMHAARGEWGRAMDLYLRSLAIQERHYGDLSLVLLPTLLNLAMLHRTRGQPQDALEVLSRIQAVPGARSASPELAATAMLVSAMIRQEEGRREEAIFLAKEAILLLQTVRQAAASLDAEFRRSLTLEYREAYMLLARWLAEAQRFAESEQVIELLKDHELRELQDDTAARTPRMSWSTSEGRLDAEYRALLDVAAARMVALETLPPPPRGAAAEAPEQEARRRSLMDEQRRARNAIQAFLTRIGPALLQPGGALPPQDSALRGFVRESNRTTPLRHVSIGYLVSPDNLFIVLTSAEGFVGRQVPLKSGELDVAVSELRRVLASAQWDPRPAAQALYRMLMQPIEKELAALRPDVLVFNLTEALRYVPMAALHDGQRYVAERYAVALYASAGFQGIHLREGTDWTVAGLGLTRASQVRGRRFPALPGVAQELTAIVRDADGSTGVLPGQKRIDQAFTARAVEEALLAARQGRVRVMHIASHFHLAKPRDGDSYLVTGEDQPMTLRDLRALDFHGLQLVVLSACNTAQLARGSNGTEVEGLAATVQSGGAESILATLWQVGDASTAALMASFYGRRTRAIGRAPTHAQALREAQVSLLAGPQGLAEQRSPVGSSIAPDVGWLPPATGSAPGPLRPFIAPSGAPYAHPYYWAPFVLTGNWL